MSKIDKIKKAVAEISPDVKVEEVRGCIRLTGELDDWDKIVRCGKAAVDKKHYLGVLNDIKLKGFVPNCKLLDVYDDVLDGAEYDVVIIGAGICGASIARQLSKWKLKVALLEKDYDVALGASSRNDGCVHVGIDLHRNTQKLRYTIPGNEMYTEMCKDLDVKFERTGHMLLFYRKWERVLAPAFKIQAKLLGVKGLRYETREQLLRHEPYIPSWSQGGIFMPTGGIVSPYKLTVALAENAAANGVDVFLNTAVLDIKLDGDKISEVVTNHGTIKPKVVINCAGAFSDTIADLAGDRTFTIHPRKGTNLIMDKKVGWLTRTSIARSPFAGIPEAGQKEAKTFFEKLKNFFNVKNSKSNTKGGGVIHTADGNVLVGPNAIETPQKEDYTTDIDSINSIFRKQQTVGEPLKKSDIITYFSGVRAPTYEEDFVVRPGIFTKNIIEVAGIQSPGLTAAPAIAVDVEKWTLDMLKQDMKVEPNVYFNPKRKGPPHLADMDKTSRDLFIKQNPDYGVIVCRCEEVSKGEILDCLRSPIPVYSVDAIKRRCRPGMGRCQGGFCGPMVVDIIAKEAGISPEKVMKGNDRSPMLLGKTKEGK